MGAIGSNDSSECIRMWQQASDRCVRCIKEAEERWTRDHISLICGPAFIKTSVLCGCLGWDVHSDITHLPLHPATLWFQNLSHIRKYKGIQSFLVPQSAYVTKLFVNGCICADLSQTVFFSLFISSSDWCFVLPTTLWAYSFYKCICNFSYSYAKGDLDISYITSRIAGRHSALHKN